MKTYSAPEFGNYEPATPFDLPLAAGGSYPLFDVLGDGRIVVTDGAWVYVESSLGSRTFQHLKNIGGSYSAYIKVSNNGYLIAVDSQNRVIVFDSRTPDQAQSFDPGPGYAGYDAEWLDDQRLAISGLGTGVAVLKPADGSTTEVIKNVGGSAAGVTLDSSGRLFTANGLDAASGGSETGSIKGFLKAEWEQALSSQQPLDFEATGILVADLLSAGYLNFDSDGNMCVGGGIGLGGTGPEVDKNYAALVSAEAIEAALAGGPPVTHNSPSSVLHTFDPDTSSDDSFYFVNANRVTKELYLMAYANGTTTVYVYKKISS